MEPATLHCILVSLIHDTLVCLMRVCRRAVVQKPDGSGETAFSFDRVYGGRGAPFQDLYPASVAPLVDGLFEGYSATAFAYGALKTGISCCLRTLPAQIFLYYDCHFQKRQQHSDKESNTILIIANNAMFLAERTSPNRLHNAAV